MAGEQANCMHTPYFQTVWNTVYMNIQPVPLGFELGTAERYEQSQLAMIIKADLYMIISRAIHAESMKPFPFQSK